MMDCAGFFLYIQETINYGDCLCDLWIVLFVACVDIILLVTGRIGGKNETKAVPVVGPQGHHRPEG